MFTTDSYDLEERTERAAEELINQASQLSIRELAEMHTTDIRFTMATRKTKDKQHRQAAHA